MCVDCITYKNLYDFNTEMTCLLVKVLYKKISEYNSLR